MTHNHNDDGVQQHECFTILDAIKCYPGAQREWEETLRELETLRARADQAEADAARMRLSLENVRMLAKRMRRRGTYAENAAHLLRFCEDAGVVDNILRGAES